MAIALAGVAGTPGPRRPGRSPPWGMPAARPTGPRPTPVGPTRPVRPRGPSGPPAEQQAPPPGPDGNAGGAGRRARSGPRGRLGGSPRLSEELLRISGLYLRKDRRQAMPSGRTLPVSPYVEGSIELDQSPSSKNMKPRTRKSVGRKLEALPTARTSTLGWDEPNIGLIPNSSRGPQDPSQPCRDLTTLIRRRRLRCRWHRMDQTDDQRSESWPQRPSDPAIAGS